jgi:hypothetical protein
MIIFVVVADGHVKDAPAGAGGHHLASTLRIFGACRLGGSN